MKFLVVEEHAETVTTAHQISVVFGQLVDALYLFIQEMSLKVIAQVNIVVFSCSLVQIQQRLTIKNDTVLIPI